MEKRNKIIFLIEATAANLFVAFNVFALEIKDYPIINGLVLPVQPTFDQWAGYFFSMALVIGIVAAVGVIIFAGVRILFSKGDTARTGSSKSMMVRALVGLALLFGSVLVLNAINSNIALSKIKQIKAGENLDGIVLVETKPDGSEEVWTNQAYPRVDYPVTAIRWISNKEDLPAIFIYPEPNFKGIPLEIKNGQSAAMAVGNSFVLDWRTMGVYLYDDENLKLKNIAAPLPLTMSQPALAKVNFDKLTKSIRINNPKTGGDGFGAIIFSKPDYQGKCAWLTKDINKLSEAKSKDELKEVSSVYVFRTTVNVQGVVFYGNANCSDGKDIEFTKYRPNSCKVMLKKADGQEAWDVNPYGKETSFKSGCSEMYYDEAKGPIIVSMLPDDNTVVLLKDKDGNCQIFKKQGNDRCISSIKYGNIYAHDKEIWPETYTLLPPLPENP
ncbi:MAG: hypothetical protein WC470_01830 [Candidatus Paceibacterota bacterium]